MRTFEKVSKGLVVGCVAGVIGFGVFSASASAVRPIGGLCNKGIYCLDVWDPVTCPNGQTYSNDCYARRACQTGCWPSGAM